MAWIEGMNPRSKEHFKVNFALTERLKSGPIIFMQNILNSAALSLNTPLSLSLSLLDHLVRLNKCWHWSNICKQLEEVRSSSFLSLCKIWKFLKTKMFSLVSIKKNLPKSISKQLVQVWFASVFAPSSAASGSPWKILGEGGVSLLH